MVPKKILLGRLPIDQYSEKILDSLDRPKTISEISRDCKISKPTIYRRIKLLEKLELLDVSGNIIDGVKFRMFKQSPFYKHAVKNPRGAEIVGCVSKNPGICFTELQEMTGYPTGTLSYSISKLLDENKLVTKKSGRRTWFFSPKIPQKQFELIINLRKETSKNILLFLLLKPRATFKEIRNFVKKSPPTISLTLTHLNEIGIVKRIPGIHPRYELTDKETTLETVKKIEPSLVDKLKDRFADTFSYL